MKYEKVEKAKAAKAAEAGELDQMALAYAKSDSMAEFRLKASAEGLSKSKFMKWFRLFYFLKNHSVYGLFPWLVFVLSALLAMTATGVGVEYMSDFSKDGGWQCLCASTFLSLSLVWTGCAFLLFRHINNMLDRVKDAVWHNE